ncbi:glycosyltransferase [Pelagovum pacificum]|uniref:Glycosyl transferase n=1 Tax=Pelagovum pacificum TaxID=2588711 RepID=A0A5C5GG94_9RHOB|nr:glycosyltransferase [Pelagovum pacificum]QQA43155.1 glycosyl transferase [Pelagovum pacificum]TNY33703.1 glycosyl transferase [Pelagovum pacificum]
MTGIHASRPPRGDRAYVTLVTSDDYATGANALIRSLNQTGTEADIAVLHTGGVSSGRLEELERLGVRLCGVDLLPTSAAFNNAHAREVLHRVAPFDKGDKPPLHTPLDNFTKLRLWQLDYARCTFIDADALAMQNCDRLFEYPEFCAAPNVYESEADFHRMNSGVFTARPSQATFDHMFETLDVPDAFWRRTDQTFLQTYFTDWHGLPHHYNVLQYVWFNLPKLWNWKSMHILHFQYEKPWQTPHGKADQLRPLIDLWTTIAEGGPLPDLAKMPNPE